jgi:hypothetical protein
MVDFPLKVKRRDATGAVAEVLCDDLKGARENFRHFREAAYKQIWIEDVHGRKVGEEELGSSLRAKSVPATSQAAGFCPVPVLFYSFGSWLRVANNETPPNASRHRHCRRPPRR